MSASPGRPVTHPGDGEGPEGSLPRGPSHRPYWPFSASGSNGLPDRVPACSASPEMPSA